LVILAEIRDTLKQIDERLQRLEQAAAKAAARKPHTQHSQPPGAR
jgi:hypothetical protein